MKRKISKRRQLKENAAAVMSALAIADSVKKLREDDDEDNEEELKRNNIVGEEEKQDTEEDAESLTATPTGQSTGEVSAEQPAVVGVQQKEEKDESDPILDYVIQQLKKRGDNMNQQNQQEFFMRQQEYNKFMKEIEDYIAQNKPKK